MLTPSQKTTLKTDRAANTTNIQAFVSGQTGLQTVQIKNVEDIGDNFQFITDWYNKGTAAYWVLRTSLLRADVIGATGKDTDGTTDTNLTIGGATGGYIARSQAERDAFDRALFDSSGSCNPSRANIRTAFDDIFSGNGAGAQGNRAHFRALSRRLVTNVEKLYVAATTGGPSQSGSRGAATNPDTLVFEGPLTFIDFIDALTNG